MVRRLGFTPEDDAALARACVAVSHGHDEANAILFRDAVREALQKQENKTDSERSSESLCSQWDTLQCYVQKYIAAERVCLSKPVSSEIFLDAKRSIMELYSSRNHRKDAFGVVRDGASLRSLEAVAVLRDCLKFSAKSESNSQDSEAYRFTSYAN